MPGSEQHGSSDIVVFRDLDIELTGWPSGDGIGIPPREVVSNEGIGPILAGGGVLGGDPGLEKFGRSLLEGNPGQVADAYQELLTEGISTLWVSR